MKKISISPDTTIRQAMEILDSTKEKCLAVVNEEETLLGTLAYSDLRKSILAGAVFNSTIEQNYNNKPTTLVEGHFSEKDVRELLKSPKIKMIPIINDSGRYVNFLSWDHGLVAGGEVEHKKLESPVIIMAGGRGARLDPFTKLLPKPLLPKIVLSLKILLMSQKVVFLVLLSKQQLLLIKNKLKNSPKRRKLKKRNKV